jgi:hypothetical protein
MIGSQSRPSVGLLYFATDRSLPIVDDDTLRANVDRFAALGVDQVIIDLQTTSRDELLPILDRYAAALALTPR